LEYRINAKQKFPEYQLTELRTDEADLLVGILKLGAAEIPTSLTFSIIEDNNILEDGLFATEVLPIDSFCTFEIPLEASSREIHALSKLAVARIYLASKRAIRQCDGNFDNPVSQIQFAFDDSITAREFAILRSHPSKLFYYLFCCELGPRIHSRIHHLLLVVLETMHTPLLQCLRH
jgi:hypothetical protein